MPILTPQFQINNMPDDIVVDTCESQKLLAALVSHFAELKTKGMLQRKCSKRHVFSTKKALKDSILSSMEQSKILYLSRILLPKRFIRKWSTRIHDLKIFILPVYPCPNGRLEPERIWSTALIRLENLRIRLISLNAYIATLGGGYFLCRKLETAVALARQQCKVALALGDLTLAGQCNVNEAYNYIFAGKIDEALSIIRSVSSCAKVRDDLILIAVCRAARIFGKRVRKARKFYPNESQRNNIPSTGNKHMKYDAIISTVDDFQRIRIRQC